MNIFNTYIDQPTLIALSITLPIAIALVITFLVYIIGNVYNGFVRRKAKCETSWHELSKTIIRCYKTVPTVIRNGGLSKENHQKLVEVYKEYQSLDISHQISELASIDAKFKSITKSIDILSLPQSAILEREGLEFMLSERRNLDFAIPLYNTNVLDYERFRKLPVNRLFARLFKFNQKDYFLPKDQVEKRIETKELR